MGTYLACIPRYFDGSHAYGHHTRPLSPDELVHTTFDDSSWLGFGVRFLLTFCEISEPFVERGYLGFGTSFSSHCGRRYYKNDFTVPIAILWLALLYTFCTPRRYPRWEHYLVSPEVENASYNPCSVLLC